MALARPTGMIARSVFHMLWRRILISELAGIPHRFADFRRAFKSPGSEFKAVPGLQTQPAFPAKRVKKCRRFTARQPEVSCLAILRRGPATVAAEKRHYLIFLIVTGCRPYLQIKGLIKVHDLPEGVSTIPDKVKLEHYRMFACVARERDVGNLVVGHPVGVYPAQSRRPFFLLRAILNERRPRRRGLPS